IAKEQLTSAGWLPQHETIITMHRVWTYIRFWNVKGEFVDAATINNPINFAWSPDGNLLAIGGIGLSILTSDGKVLLTQVTFPDIRSLVTHIAWSPDGKYLAIGTDSGQVKIWPVKLPETS